MGDDEYGAELDRLAADLRSAEAAAVLTGAGVSTASGIPSFRGDGGIWNEQFDPADFHARRLASDPAGFWADRVELQERMIPEEAEPNAAHRALSEMVAEGTLEAVITQNTDGLHDAADTGEVIELHGSARRVACEDCDRRFPADPAFERARSGELPPTCNECGGTLRPDVVLFGEGLPRVAMSRARHLADESEVFLAVGSSLTVDPAASLPGIATRSGTLAVVNLDPTDYDDRAEYCLRVDVTDFLPDLADRI
jgi:NAD-dependent deacetylase